MHSKLIVLGAVALVTSALMAEEPVREPAKEQQKQEAKQPIRLTAAERAARHQQMMERHGGELVKPGSYTGLIAIVNNQGKVPDAECEKVAALFAKNTRCNFKVTKDPAGAKAVLTVIDDPKEPKILVAPMEGWAKVNVADIVGDLPTQEAKDRFFAERARKLMIKALSMLCGGAASSYPGNIMSASSVRQLDTAKELFPIDVLQRFDKYLKTIGVTPKVMTTYRKAAQEGWAPAPTNDVQKKIWDYVHTIPSKPITIKP